MISNKLSRQAILPWLIWGLGGLFYFYEFLLQVSPGVMVNELMRDFNVTATSLGNLTALYFYAYAGMQIPSGLLLDRFGPKRVLSIAVILCAAGCLFFSIAPNFYIAELARFLIGFASAFAVIGCMNLAARWFPPERFALLVGLTITLGMAGAIFGEAPMALLVKYFGWRHTLLLFMALGMILALFIWFIVRDYSEFYQEIPLLDSKTLLKNLKRILKSRKNWVTVLYAGFMYAPSVILGSLWGVPYLATEYHISHAQAALIISPIFAGWGLGSPFFGWLSNKFERRKSPIIIVSTMALMLIAYILYVPNIPTILLAILLFFLGFTSGVSLLAYSIVKEINLPQYNATILGFANTVNMIGALIAPPLIGLILDHYWKGLMINGARIYSTHNFHIALAALPLSIVLALIFAYFIPETFCQQKHD